MENKLEGIRRKLREAKDANREEVKNEYSRNKTCKISDKRAEILQNKVAELELKKLAQTTGEDIEDLKSFDWTLEDVEKWKEKQEQKLFRADTGFTDYQQLAARKYQKLTRDLKPNIQNYESQKKSIEEQSKSIVHENSEYRSANALLGHKPSADAVQKMTIDLDKQMVKRSKFSKRKKPTDDTVTYVNDRNMRFNQKIARAYDKYTSDIKAAFERGTALD